MKIYENLKVIEKAEKIVNEVLQKNDHKTGDRIVHRKHGVGTVGLNHGDGHLTVRFDSDTDHSLENKGKKVHVDELKVNKSEPLKKAYELPKETGELIGSGYNESQFEMGNLKHKGSYKTKDNMYHHVLSSDDGYHIHHTSTSQDPYDSKSSVAKITGSMSEGSFEVGSSKVKKEHAGKGLGRQAYLHTLAHHGNISSDRDLTEKSHNAWKSLPELSQGHAEVRLGKPDTDERHEAQADKAKLQKLLFNKRIAPSKKLAASEKQEDNLKKGDLLNAAKGGAAALALAHGAHYMSGDEDGSKQQVRSQEEISQESAGRSPASIKSPVTSEKNSKQNILGAISEASKDQEPLKYGEQKYGEYGLSPIVIRETIKSHPDLMEKHGYISKARGRMMREAMDAAKGLEHEVASRHYDKLSEHFGHDPEKISYAWHNGVSNTKRADSMGLDVGRHPYVRAVKSKIGNNE